MAKWYPTDGLTSSCMLCLTPGDTISHRLGACTFPAVKNQICARHGHAVHVIASEIRNGAYGNCRMIVDAACHERYEAFPRAFLPLDLQSSRPDIILFVGNDLPKQQQYSYIPARTRRDAVVHLVEVGYTSDMRVHEHVQIKLDQHHILRQNLISYGWGRVYVHDFIVGHTGVMSQ